MTRLDMDRVVIDTNIFVSAVMNPDGAPREVVRLALLGQIKPIFGNALFLEYEDVLSRERLFSRSLPDEGTITSSNWPSPEGRAPLSLLMFATSGVEKSRVRH